MQKASRIITLYSLEDRPGILRQLFRILASENWNVERVWAGEIYDTIQQDLIHSASEQTVLFQLKRHLQATIRASILHKGDKQELDELCQRMSKHISEAFNLSSDSRERMLVDVNLVPEKPRFLFSLQAEVADRRGAFKDILKNIFRPGIYVNDKEAIFQIHNCVLLPMYTRSGEHRDDTTFLLDLQFGALADNLEHLGHFADLNDLCDGEPGLTEIDVCEHIDCLLKSISGVLSWSILSRNGTKPVCSNREPKHREYFHIERESHGEIIRYERHVRSSGYPGIAYALSEFLYEDGYSIDRVNITEFIQDNDTRNLAYLRCKRVVDASRRTPDGLHKELAENAVNLHVRGLTHKPLSAKINHEEAMYIPVEMHHDSKIWISCQIEIEDRVGNLAKILEEFSSMVSSFGIILNISHFSYTHLYSNSKSEIRTSIIDILFVMEKYDEDANANSLMALTLCELMCRAVQRVMPDALIVSCKPVRSYGRSHQAERWVNYDKFSECIRPILDRSRSLFTEHELFIFYARCGLYHVMNNNSNPEYSCRSISEVFNVVRREYNELNDPTLVAGIVSRVESKFLRLARKQAEF